MRLKRPAPRPIIVIDSREQWPLRFSPQAVVCRAGIQSGADYSVLGYEHRIGIERKSLQDLVGSLTQGRDRFMRSLRLLRERPYRLLLVESTFEALAGGAYRSRATPASMVGSVVAIEAGGIPVCFAGSHELAGYWAERWLTKAWERAREEDAVGCAAWLDAWPCAEPVALRGPDEETMRKRARKDRRDAA
jgi:DNA excision repair protein ERCC-4